MTAGVITYSVHELAARAGLPAPVSSFNLRRLHTALTRHGWHRHRRKHEGTHRWVWTPPSPSYDHVPRLA